MDLMQFVAHPLSLTTELATKKVIKQFAHKFDFVYFGAVDHQEDEQQLVRGMTLSHSHLDSHFTVGHFRGHDVTLVQRQNSLTLPGKQPQHYRWLIMQLDLKRSGLPHVFIDANHHDEVFYSHLFMKFANFTNAASLFSARDPLFAKYFKVFTPPDKLDAVNTMLNTEVTPMLAHHFHQFD